MASINLKPLFKDIRNQLLSYEKSGRKLLSDLQKEGKNAKEKGHYQIEGFLKVVSKTRAEIEKRVSEFLRKEAALLQKKLEPRVKTLSKSLKTAAKKSTKKKSSNKRSTQRKSKSSNAEMEQA